MKTTNIYILIDPITNQVRYIGKANNISERYKAHLNKARKHQIHKLNWINSLKGKGLKPIIEVIDIIPIEDWIFWETYWISQFKTWGFKLINYTDGGDGTTFGNQTSFKKGNLPWNIGKYNIKQCKICSKDFKSSKSAKKKTCSKECASILKKSMDSLTRFSKNNKPWNTGLKNIKLKSSKHVFQYCAYTGKFIKEWNSAKEVQKILNINEQGIGNCCRGIAKSAGKFMWRYYKKDKIEIIENVKLKIKKVC